MAKDKRPAFNELLAFAHQLADASAAAIRPHFRRPLAVDNKAQGRAFDPVTAADRAAERAISRLLKRTYPAHGLVGEEFGSRNGEADLQWVVDPIDGTRAFIMGYPVWGTLIGLLAGGEPLIGVMDQPFTQERYFTTATGSSLRTADGKTRRLKTRGCARLEDAVFATTHPDLFAAGKEQSGFERIKSAARMTRYGGDCYAYCQLAAGHVDLIVEAGLKPYDIVALVPIITRAGGVVTTWDGRPATAGGRILATGDPKLHETAVRLLAPFA